MRGGANLGVVSAYNRSLILDAIRANDEISRVEIAQMTGLTAQTVTNIVRRLLDEELVIEAGQGPTSRGKPRTMLRLNARARFSLGVHIDPFETVYVVTDLRGGVLAAAREEATQAHDAQTSIASIARGAMDLLRAADVAPDRVVGIGVAVPGPLDVVHGVVIAPPNMSQWRDTPLQDALQRETGYPVIVDNDATAAAIGERWAGDIGSATSFACLYLGTGIGAGLFIDGQVVRGATSNAGEFGHLSVAIDGPTCGCGNRGCLELFTAPAAVVRRVAEAVAEGAPSAVRLVGSVVADYAAVVAAASQGDLVAEEALDRAARHLAAAAVTLVNLLDLELLVLCGSSVTGVGDRYVAAIRTALQTRALARSRQHVDVKVSGAGADVAALGAALLPLHTAFAPRLAGLSETTTER